MKKSSITQYDHWIGVGLALTIVACLVFVEALPGCKHTIVTPTETVVSVSTGTSTSTGLTPDQLQIITMEINGVGSDAVDLGLSAWAQQNNKLATEVAQALKDNIETVIKPYLRGGNLPSATLVLAFVRSSLGQKLPPLVSLGLTGASLILDRFFTIPNIPLTNQQVTLVTAFLDAVDGGCIEYLKSPPPVGTPMKAKNAAALKALVAPAPKVNLGRD